MKTKLLNPLTPFLAALILLTAPALAEEVLEIHFDNVPDVVCDEVWTQDGVPCHLTQTTTEDCDGGGNCFFDTSDGIWLYPARLVVDFQSPVLLYRVEIDFTDNCGVGCSQSFLYNGGLLVSSDANDQVGELEVLSMDLGQEGAMVTHLAVSSCEGQVSPSTIRIYSESPVAIDGTSWGSLKTLYR